MNSRTAFFESIAISAGSRDHGMKLAVADVLVDVDRLRKAGGLIVSMISEENMPPYWLDRALARAERILEDRDLVGMIGTMTQGSEERASLVPSSRERPGIPGLAEGSGRYTAHAPAG